MHKQSANFILCHAGRIVHTKRSTCNTGCSKRTRRGKKKEQIKRTKRNTECSQRRGRGKYVQNIRMYNTKHRQGVLKIILIRTMYNMYKTKTN